MKESEHCDEYIHRHSYPVCLRVFLLFHRLPAMDTMVFREAGFEPVLYADFQGSPVRVTMASRFGDVGISKHLQGDRGYEKRVLVSSLENFRTEP